MLLRKPTFWEKHLLITNKEKLSFREKESYLRCECERGISGSLRIFKGIRHVTRPLLKLTSKTAITNAIRF